MLEVHVYHRKKIQRPIIYVMFKLSLYNASLEFIQTIAEKNFLVLW